MPRHPYDRDRDEYGRFIPREEDWHAGPSGYRSHRGRERDERSRFMEEDDARFGRYGHERDERPRGFEDEYDRPLWGGPAGTRFREEDERAYGRRPPYPGERGGRPRFEDERRFRDEDEDRRWAGYPERERMYGHDDERWERPAMPRDEERGGYWRERDERGRFTSDEDDERGGPMRRVSRDPDHGGWYGDSRRHAQAARRGWQHRR